MGLFEDSLVCQKKKIDSKKKGFNSISFFLSLSFMDSLLRRKILISTFLPPTQDRNNKSSKWNQEVIENYFFFKNRVRGINKISSSLEISVELVGICIMYMAQSSLFFLVGSNSLK